MTLRSSEPVSHAVDNSKDVKETLLSHSLRLTSMMQAESSVETHAIRKTEATLDGRQRIWAELEAGNLYLIRIYDTVNGSRSDWFACAAVGNEEDGRNSIVRINNLCGRFPYFTSEFGELAMMKYADDQPGERTGIGIMYIRVRDLREARDLMNDINNARKQSVEQSPPLKVS